MNSDFRIFQSATQTFCTMYNCGWKFSRNGFILKLLRYAITAVIMKKKKGQQRVIFTQVNGSIPILYQVTYLFTTYFLRS